MASPRPYRDRFGHRHSQAVFDNWHPRVLEFMQIKKVRRSPAEVAEDDAAHARARLRGSK